MSDLEKALTELKKAIMAEVEPVLMPVVKWLVKWLVKLLNRL